MISRGRRGLVGALILTVTVAACKTAEPPPKAEAPRAPVESALTGYYFKVPEKHPDVERGMDSRIVVGMMGPSLGPHGLPVASAFGRSGQFPSGPITDVNTDGEVLWWSSASTKGVRVEKIVNDRLPFKFPTFYPDGQQGDSPFFRAVHWRGTFTTPADGVLGLTLGSDDDSWVYVDGKLVIDNGGVKTANEAPYQIGGLAAGNHMIAIFYIDRKSPQAALTFASTLALAPVAPGKSAADMRAELRERRRVTVYDLRFAFDSAELTDESLVTLAEIAKLLQDDLDLRLRVEGHTDNVGAPTYNARLSQRRADAVKMHLVRTFNISPARLETRGFGDTKPVADNVSEEGRARNRRVELVDLSAPPTAR
jgi:fibro-slime domain-containing protein